MAPRDVWVFGYGSLIWRPAFPHRRAVPATVRGWMRRFWQGSIDHRGVPGAPGRVVTLIPSPDDEVWGTAFLVDGAQWDTVKATLDHREQHGYAQVDATFHLIDGTDVAGVFYVADSRNHGWLGPAPLDHIARTIASSVGPSGSNREYLLELDAALAEMGADDPHVEALATLVRLGW